MTCNPLCWVRGPRVAVTCNQQQDCWYQQNPSAVPQHVLVASHVPQGAMSGALSAHRRGVGCTVGSHLSPSERIACSMAWRVIATHCCQYGDCVTATRVCCECTDKLSSHGLCTHTHTNAHHFRFPGWLYPACCLV
jgi:hypothetical protein